MGRTWADVAKAAPQSNEVYSNAVDEGFAAEASRIKRAERAAAAKAAAGSCLQTSGAMCWSWAKVIGGYIGECIMLPIVGPDVPHELLVFPDTALPCRNWLRDGTCRRSGCSYAHEETSLTKLLDEFKKAKESLRVCVFNITLNEIADCLIACHDRGIHVKVITDDEQQTSQGSDVERLAQAGVKVRNDKSEWLMHHKFSVVDDHTVLTGSFNYTQSAVLRNREHVLVLRSWRMAKDYVKLFDGLWEQYEDHKVR